MRDRYLPPPLGDTRASFVICDQHFRERVDAELFLVDNGLGHADATDYVDVLIREYHTETRKLESCLTKHLN